MPDKNSKRVSFFSGTPLGRASDTRKKQNDIYRNMLRKPKNKPKKK